MITKAEFSALPDKILFEADQNGNRVWMRKNIITEQREMDSNKYTAYTADEVYFETATDRDTIESDFDSWFEFGESWTAESVGEQSIEERVTNLENALLEMLGV